MGSPFPGMDPFLEDPVVWPGLHHLLIGHLGAALNRVLPPAYVARIGERLYVVQPDRSIVPDVTVRAAPRAAELPAATAAQASAVLAVDPAWEVVAQDEEHREGYVEILGPPPARDVVSVLEVLSPANKTAGGIGRDQYVRKQREVLAGPAHLLEVDLLRGGTHTVAAPRAALLARGTFDYLVSLSRAADRGRFTVWARTVRDRLPRFLVPLLGDDGHVAVDLQDVFDASYADGGFARSVDYSATPVPPLAPPDEAWVRGVLSGHGSRPGAGSAR
jgi:hypothetical protein